MIAESRSRIFHITVGSAEAGTATEILARHAGLSKGKIKDAMGKGAVWLHSGKRGRKRLRRASTPLKPGDVLDFFYDPQLLVLLPPSGQCLHDAGHYSVWFKPAGLLAQGTDYGDHCSLLRQVELHFRKARPALPVHRLDREASGLMLIAHDSGAAARLSALLQENRIEKGYRIRVKGKPTEREGAVDLPLDGKEAKTSYQVTAYDEKSDTATVEVRIATGRLHQIRRHFALLGHPVLGDPRYGRGNKNSAGLQLVAYSLAFRCPFSNKEIRVRLAEDLIPWG
ncbi:RluA family pseudouridine synthase [Thiovibrio sp. JS02]